MGFTVLYVAFGAVGLWLLGEVLLQHKARLRWRLLAFVGFLGVAVGVGMASVPLIAVGAVAFATGQTLVTLSFRKGFRTGWALRNPMESSGGRRRARTDAPPAEPAPHVTDVEEAPGEGAEAGYGPDGGYQDLPPDAPLDDDRGGPDPQGPYDGYEGPGGGPQGPFGAAADAEWSGGYADGGYGNWQEDPGRDLLHEEDVFRGREYIPGGSYAAAQDHHGYGADGTYYTPQPLPEDTGQYGVYSTDARPQEPVPGGYGQDYQQHGGYDGHDGYEGHDGYGATADATYGYGPGHDGAGDPSYGVPPGYADPSGYGAPAGYGDPPGGASGDAYGYGYGQSGYDAGTAPHPGDAQGQDFGGQGQGWGGDAYGAPASYDPYAASYQGYEAPYGGAPGYGDPGDGRLPPQRDGQAGAPQDWEQGWAPADQHDPHHEQRPYPY